MVRLLKNSCGLVRGSV